ncbi:MAG TPA: ABC transporter ATP-binding protein/permease [Myxococcales bacterium LLY-WYZ-16_1]|nr:ABC transporter ATP-binding protein/permease [Myxococcales bacterium LLY-WYZ-16_1]
MAAPGGWRALRDLGPYLWPKGEPALRLRVVVALAAIFAGKVLNVWVPIFYKRAVDALETDSGLPALPLALILAYGAARVGALLFNQVRDAVFETVGQRATRRAALNVFRHLHALSMRFHLRRQTGGLARAVERGTSAISSLLDVALFNVLPTLFELALVLVVLLQRFRPAFAGITLVTVVVYVAFTIWTTEWRLKFRRRMNEADSDASTKAIDSLLNYETVKSFGNEGFEATRYEEALGRYERAAVQSQTSLSVLNAGQAAIIGTGVTLLMYLAARGIVDGRLTVGDFVLVNTYLIQLAQPLNLFGWVYRSIKQHLVNMEQMFALLDERPDVQEDPRARALPPGPRTVSFEDVFFSYDPDRPILRGVSFDVPAGNRVALVGPSGAGKSTIARLLFRFYDVDAGAIRIDGIDVRELTVDSLRRSIGLVPQDTVLFNDTLAYNLAYARPEAGEAELRRAARQAQLHDFIARLPEGYETVVGERGLKLSGGEKQRVAIARVFLKEPSILVLDEATSALDSATEQQIQAQMRAVSEGRTTLIIAHRLSTIVDADEIVVLDRGRVVERGHHNELLGRNGLYADMWRKQLAEEAPARAV